MCSALHNTKCDPIPTVHPCAQKGEAKARLAISDLNAPAIHIFDARSGTDSPEAVVEVSPASALCCAQQAVPCSALKLAVS